MARIYVASSWRNSYQPGIVGQLRTAGHQVYDFRNPPHGDSEVAWSDTDPEWKNWNGQAYREKLLKSPIAAYGFLTDLRGMQWADTCLLVMPCGRSAHLELGWCAGAGKRTIILLDDDGEPELMNLLADDICLSPQEVLDVLKYGSPGTTHPNPLNPLEGGSA